MTMAALLMMNQFNRHDDGPMPCPQDLYFPIFYRPEVCQSVPGKKITWGVCFSKREVLGAPTLRF